MEAERKSVACVSTDEGSQRVLRVVCEHYWRHLPAESVLLLRSISLALQPAVDAYIQTLHVSDASVARAGRGGCPADAATAASRLSGLTARGGRPCKAVIRLPEISKKPEAAKAYACAALGALRGPGSRLHHLVLQGVPLAGAADSEPPPGVLAAILAVAPQLTQLELLNYPAGCAATCHGLQALAAAVGATLRSLTLGGEAAAAPELLSCLPFLPALTTLTLTADAQNPEWEAAVGPALATATQVTALTLTGFSAAAPYGGAVRLRLPDMWQGLAELRLPDALLAEPAMAQLQRLGGLTRLRAHYIALRPETQQPLPPRLQWLELSHAPDVRSLAALRFPASMQRRAVPGLALSSARDLDGEGRLLPGAAAALERALAALERWLDAGGMSKEFWLRLLGEMDPGRPCLPPASWGGSWAPLLASLGRLCGAGRCPPRLRFEWGLDSASLAEHLPQLQVLVAQVRLLGSQDLLHLSQLQHLQTLQVRGVADDAAAAHQAPLPLPPRLQCLSLTEPVRLALLAALQFPASMRRLAAPGLHVREEDLTQGGEAAAGAASALSRALSVLERWFTARDMDGTFVLTAGAAAPGHPPLPAVDRWGGGWAPLLACLGRLCGAGRCPPRLKVAADVGDADGGLLAALAEHMPMLRTLDAAALALPCGSLAALAALRHLEELSARALRCAAPPQPGPAPPPSPLPPRLRHLELREPVPARSLAALRFPASMQRLVVPGLALEASEWESDGELRLLPGAAAALERALAALERWLDVGGMPGMFGLDLELEARDPQLAYSGLARLTRLGRLVLNGTVVAPPIASMPLYLYLATRALAALRDQIVAAAGPDPL